MPKICEFYGIVITMHFGDHAPPHFHATYGEDEAVFAIDTLKMIEGSLPRRARALVLEWAFKRRPELERAWSRAVTMQAPGRIPPLD